MAKSDLRIDVLGTSFSITTDEEPEYLKKLLDKYRRTIENVQRISGLKDPLKTAVLTGFLLCDDLEKAGIAAPGEKTGQSLNGEKKEAEILTLGMISRLDELVSAQGASQEAAPEAAQVAAQDAALPQKVPQNVSVFKLQNAVKYYDWGSPEWIPELLGQKNLSRVPWAELWMGVHPSGPSRVVLSDGTNLPLAELIERDPPAFLGEQTAKTSGRLPFLFKVEAAAKPLSIQAHPNREQAREGFERENRLGIPRDAPNRNYPDSNHKPEIICALSPFAALCGFRSAGEIKKLICFLSARANGRTALKTRLENLVSVLESQDENPYRNFLAGLFSLETESRHALGTFIKTQTPLLKRDFPEYRDEWELCSYFAALYPEDPSIIAPLYLNVVELAPEEAMYLPSGVLHAYIHGMGIELMSDSDNVLRGGLTSKHVDLEELFRIVDFSEYKSEIMKVPGSAPAWYSYPAPTREFMLSVMHGFKENAGFKESAGIKENDSSESTAGSDRTDGTFIYPETGPSIVLVTGGKAVITEPGKSFTTVVSKGESVFIPAGEKANMVFSGIFTAFIAACGSS